MTQQFVGAVDRTGPNGTVRKMGLGDEESDAPEASQPFWWNYDSSDWRALNGLSSVSWKIPVPANKSLEVPYSYHYFWR